MVMERKELGKILTHFQARARGYLLRKAVRHARADFQDIVREIDGNLNHLRWRDAILSIPHFTDTDGPLPRNTSSKSASTPKLHCPETQPPEHLLEKTEREPYQQLFPEKIEAERDGLPFQKQPLHPRECSQGIPAGGRDQRHADVSHSHHDGPQQHHLTQDVPLTQEALRLHRNTLSMELLWLQQAITSRKKKCLPPPAPEMAEGTGGTTSLLPPVKSVVVYRNGDPFYCGRRFVVNQRQVATMEAFLNEVTQNIGAPLAIRNLFTPKQGHRVSHFQDLHTGGHYVAAGFERFKKLDYLNTGSKKPLVAREGTQARVNQRPNVSAKWRKIIPIPCIIHVFRNGDLLCPPFRFIIPRSMQHDLEQILRMVTEKASLRTGAVRRLCSLDGATVSMGEELETGQCYVAVGTERFRKLPYVELWLSKVQRNKRMGKRAEMMKPATGPEDRFSDSALLDSPLADGRRVKSSGDEATEAGTPQANQSRVIGEGCREESRVFPARPVRIHRNWGQPRVPVRNGPEQTNSLYYKKAGRRRREEVLGAQEVQDDENTHTELPVDQRVAEVVEDAEESHDADVQPQNTEKQINGKMRTTDGSPEHPRPSTPRRRDSSVQFQNETQLYQKHPELRKSDVNKVHEAEQHNGSQADLGQEQTAAISRVSSSTSLGSRSRQVQEKNGAVEGDGSSPQSPNSPKVSLPKSPADIMEKSKGPVTKNGGPINQITT